LWCDCGQDHQLNEDDVACQAEDLRGDLPEWLTHAQVIAVAAELWQLKSVCRFFTTRAEDAARLVNSEVADYPLPEALAIVKAFTDPWCGAPMRSARGANCDYRFCRSCSVACSVRRRSGVSE